MGGRLITEKGEAMRGFVGTAHCISKMTREQNGQTRVEFAMDQIIQHILELNMRPGDQLPSEYELSKKLGVGRSTLREAIKRLVSRNVLETRQGAGTFVAEKTGVPEDPLGLTFISEGDNIKLALELSDVRMLVEPACAALAADHATSAQVKKMYELCEEIKLAARDYDPSHINRCLQELAACFHRFYTACRIRGEEPQVAAARLKLADDTRMVLKNGLKLIGVDAPEKM